VRLFTDVSFLSSDFGTLPSGKIYVQLPSLVTSLNYAKNYHDAGIAVTLCIQLSLDRSMSDGSLLVDKKGNSRTLTPTELRSPKVFRTWYDALSKAQISKTDRTSVTKVLDFWEIGNEVNNATYWPRANTTPDGGVADQMNSYVDHDLIPAYDVLSKIREPVIGAGLASGGVDQYNELNNAPGPRLHQYSDHVDYLNFHPYGYFNNPVAAVTPQAYVQDFTSATYGDGTVTKPFVISEYNISDNAQQFALDPDPNPGDASDQLALVRDIDTARAALLTDPHVQAHCAWIYYYRLIATETFRNEPYLPPAVGNGPATPMPAAYDLVKRWAKGTGAAPVPQTSAGIVNLGNIAITNAIAVQKDGKILVLSDDGVRRYDSAGHLDSTYGKSGLAKLSFLGKSLALQGDGNLIVGGLQYDLSDTRYHLVVTRLSTSGKVDTGFAASGYFTQKEGSRTSAEHLALRAGKIVVAGRFHDITNGEIIRLNLDGSVDTAFGVDGVSVINGQGAFGDVFISKSGAITTYLSPNLLSPQTYVVRLNSKGRLDRTFSKNGITDPEPLRADGMFVNGDGSVELVGHQPLGPITFKRYTSSGQPDAAFGDKSIVVAGTLIEASPIELPDGSRYLYGSIAPGVASVTGPMRVFVARLTADDQLDKSFGSSGILTLSSPNVQDVPVAASIASASSLTIAAATFTLADEGGMSQELISAAGLS
jgi:uncharacterized delta-60 repeat protein